MIEPQQRQPSVPKYSVVNKELSFKAKVKDLTFKAKDLTSEHVQGPL